MGNSLHDRAPSYEPASSVLGLDESLGPKDGYGLSHRAPSCAVGLHQVTFARQLLPRCELANIDGVSQPICDLPVDGAVASRVNRTSTGAAF